MDTLEQLLYDYITNPDWSALAKGDQNAMPRIIVAEGPILSALSMRMYMASPMTAAKNIVHALRECLTLLADEEAQRLGEGASGDPDELQHLAEHYEDLGRMQGD